MAAYNKASIKIFYGKDPHLKIYYPLAYNLTEQKNNGPALVMYNSDPNNPNPFFIKNHPLFPSIALRPDSAENGPYLESGTFNLTFTNFTIMAWAKTNGLVPGWYNADARQVIASLGRVAVNGNVFIAFVVEQDESTIRDNLLRISVYTKNISTGNWYWTTSLTRILKFGRWYFVAATYNADNGNVCLYVDGELVRVRNIGAGQSFGGSFQVNIGAQEGNTYPWRYHLNGEVAEVAFFTRVLSPAEISSYYKWATRQKKYFSFQRFLYPTSSFLISGQTISQIKTQNSTTFSLSVSESNKLKTFPPSSSIQFLTTANSKREIPKQLIKDIKTEKINFDITNQP